MAKKVLVMVGLALSGLVVVSTTADAVPIQKFDFMGTGGTISYTENVGNSFLADALVQSLIRISPGSAHYTISGGTMSVVTGGCNNGTNCYTPNGHDQLVLTFANSGPNGVDIMGGVTFSATSPFNIAPGSTLLTGALTDTGAVFNGSTAPSNPNTGGLSGEISASFINPKLLEGLGLLPANSSNPEQSIAQLDFMFSAVFGINNTIGGLGNTTDSSIRLTDFTVTETPEPASLLLFGTVFLFAAGALRRKLASQ